MDILKLDWNQYHKYIDDLAETIKINKSKDEDSLPYGYIAGLESDDMIVAVHLSHTLKLPTITDINLLSLLNDFVDSSDAVLVVSNIVETGQTFETIMTQTGSQFDTACIFKDKKSKYNPTHYVEVPDQHVYFPWQQCGL